MVPRCKAGAIIIAEGDPAGELYFVVKGSVNVYVNWLGVTSLDSRDHGHLDAGGKQQHVGTQSTGVFGERELWPYLHAGETAVRSQTVVAVSIGCVAFIPYSALRDVESWGPLLYEKLKYLVQARGKEERKIAAKKQLSTTTATTITEPWQMLKSVSHLAAYSETMLRALVRLCGEMELICDERVEVNWEDSMVLVVDGIVEIRQDSAAECEAVLSSGSWYNDDALVESIAPQPVMEPRKVAVVTSSTCLLLLVTRETVKSVAKRIALRAKMRHAMIAQKMASSACTARVETHVGASTQAC